MNNDFLQLLAKQRSDGQSDSIPATITTKEGKKQPAALSEGEYVIRADAVSNLGGGATDPGAQFLDELVKLVLTMDRETAATFADTVLQLGQIALDTQPKIEDTQE